MRENKEQRQQQIQVALAGARHRLAMLHQRFAHERLAAFPTTPPADVVEAYAQTHNLDELETQSLGNRILATFATSADPALPAPLPAVAPPAPLVEPVHRGFVDRLFRRPPRDPEHDTWLAMHVGHTEAALLQVHAENVVAILDATGEDASGISEATDLYIRETSARSDLGGAIAVLATDMLYRRFADQRPAAESPPLIVEATPSSGPNHGPDRRQPPKRGEIDRIVQNRMAAGE